MATPEHNAIQITRLLSDGPGINAPSRTPDTRQPSENQPRFLLLLLLRCFFPPHSACFSFSVSPTAEIAAEHKSCSCALSPSSPKKKNRKKHRSPSVRGRAVRADEARRPFSPARMPSGTPGPYSGSAVRTGARPRFRTAGIAGCPRKETPDAGVGSLR